MKIYADVLFFINLVSSYIMLDLTARFTCCRPKVPRHLLAAAIGGLAAVVGFCAGDYAGAIKLITCAALPVTAFGFRGPDTVRHIIVFSLMSVIMAGIFAFISGINASQTVRIRNGIMYFDLPAMRFLIIFAASYFAITAAMWIIRRRRRVSRRSVAITLNGVTARVTALVDSGNVLKEPITGKDVIIAEWNVIKQLFGGIEYPELKKNAEKYKLWIIPYHSLGNRGGLIYAFLADDINIIDEKRRAGKLFIGITNDKLSAKDEYNALMGVSV